jgi:hypothetical protein
VALFTPPPDSVSVGDIVPTPPPKPEKPFSETLQIPIVPQKPKPVPAALFTPPPDSVPVGDIVPTQPTSRKRTLQETVQTYQDKVASVSQQIPAPTPVPEPPAAAKQEPKPDNQAPKAARTKQKRQTGSKPAPAAAPPSAEAPAATAESKEEIIDARSKHLLAIEHRGPKLDGLSAPVMRKLPVGRPDAEWDFKTYGIWPDATLCKGCGGSGHFAGVKIGLIECEDCEGRGWNPRPGTPHEVPITD